MKKALSLILALVLCLGLCACGKTNSETHKYVGTYTTESDSYYEMPYGPEAIWYYETLTLNDDGTGRYTKTAANSGALIAKDAELESGDVNWEVVDGYIVVKYSGKKYITNTETNHFCLGTAVTVSDSWTFELKANLLMDVATGKQEYTKAQ